MQANDSNSHTESAGAAGGGRLAAVVYTGTSVVAGLIFWLVTTLTGHYPSVARYGGAAWVFLLMMIVLMPIVIPRIERRRGRRRPGGSPAAEGPGAAGTACPLE